jgi:hypothetical protein
MRGPIDADEEVSPAHNHSLIVNRHDLTNLTRR